MKLRGFQIEGFGIFSNFSTQNLSRGLTVVYGENEAGKSTLHHFFKVMLYGFPSLKKKLVSRYEPQNGGRHGGSLWIESGNETIRISRFHERKASISIQDSQGREREPEILDALLHGTDAEVFGSIFAFDLDELRSFDSLSVDGVRDRIFSAGIFGAGRSAEAVLKALEEKNNLLLRPRKESVLGDLHQELLSLESALSKAKDELKKYPEILARKESFNRELSALAEEKDRLKKRQEEARRLGLLREELLRVSPHAFWLDEHANQNARQFLDQRESAIGAASDRLRENQIKQDERTLLFAEEKEKLLAREPDRTEMAQRFNRSTLLLRIGMGSSFLGLLLILSGFVSLGYSAIALSLAVLVYCLIERRAGEASAIEHATWERSLKELELSFSTRQVLLEEEAQKIREELDKQKAELVTWKQARGVGALSDFQEMRAFLRDRDLFFQRVQEFAVLGRVEKSSLLAHLAQAPGQNEVQQFLGALEALEETEKRLQQEYIEIELAVRRLESAEESIHIETRYAEVLYEFQKQLRQWKVQTLAQRLISNALLEFTVKRQPAVLGRASEMFQYLTQRYVSIIQELKEDTLAVIDSEGNKKHPEQLSRGTLEQLYLCLRLALAEDFATRVGALPIVIDDVLVNFDAERAQRTAKLLLGCADKLQILFFTCHDSTRKLFQNIDEQVGMLELGKVVSEPSSGHLENQPSIIV